MGKVIAVANQKGGVGKTTTAINLAAGLAEKEKKTLLIDLDSQGNATSGVGIEKNEVENTTYELISGKAAFDDTVIHTQFNGLDVLPSGQDLTAAEIELLEEEGREAKLKKVIDPIKGKYDFIIIDCPPSLSMLTVNALTAADSVLIPIQCEYYALEGLSQLLQTVSLVQERVNPALKVEGLVFTMYDSRLRLSRQVVQNVKENLEEKMFKTLIPRNVRLAEAPSHGLPIMYYTRFCAGTRAYRNLAKEIIGGCIEDPGKDSAAEETVEAEGSTETPEADLMEKDSAAEEAVETDASEEVSEAEGSKTDDAAEQAETAASDQGEEPENPVPEAESAAGNETLNSAEADLRSEHEEEEETPEETAAEEPQPDPYASLMERAEKEINGQ